MKPLFLITIVWLLCWSCTPAETQETAVSLSFNAETFKQQGAQTFYQWSADRIPLVSAHRGGPYPGLPENALATFEHIAALTPAIIECDIAMTHDSVLVMMHDNTLDRTTTGTGKVIEQDWEALKALYLVDNEGNQTEHRIPTLKETLEWGKGKVLFTLDVKRGVPFEKVVEMVQATESGPYATIITYNANDAQRVYQLDSSLMISVGLGSQEAYEAHKQLGIPDDNMIAFVGVREPTAEHYQFLHNKGITCILGVLGNLDKQVAARGDSLYEGFVKRGADILATDRPVEAAAILKDLIPNTSSKRPFFNEN